MVTIGSARDKQKTVIQNTFCMLNSNHQITKIDEVFMKKIICIFIGFIILNVCVPVQAAQTSKPAAPYTKQASEKIADLLGKYGLPPTPVKQHITSSDMLETYIQYYAEIWGLAGYDFVKSVNKYIHDINVNPDALSTPTMYGYTTPEALGYTTIQNFYQGNEDKLVLKKYFSQETINSFDKNLPLKPKYWFSQEVDPSKLSTEQKAPYKILSENQYKYNYDPLVKQKVKEAAMQGRPVIQKDLDDVERDYEILKNIRATLNSTVGVDINAEEMRNIHELGLRKGTSYSNVGVNMNSSQHQSLSQSQITELNRIVNEYGIDIINESRLLDQKDIVKYLYARPYNGQSNFNGTYQQTQTTTTTQTNVPDRTDIMRFYNGNNYYTQNSNTNSSGFIDKIINSLFGLIHY